MSTITGTMVTSGVTLSTAGAYTSPLTIASDGAVEVASGDAITGPNSQAWVVENDGTVTAANGSGIYLGLGGTVSNNGSAALIATGTGFGVDIRGAAGTVHNSGTIRATTGTGVFLNTGGYVDNSAGLLTGSGSGVYIKGGIGLVSNGGTITGYVYGINLRLGGTVSNIGSTALIDASLAHGVLIAGGAAGTVINSGTIRATTGAGGRADGPADGMGWASVMSRRSTRLPAPPRPLPQ